MAGPNARIIEVRTLAQGFGHLTETDFELTRRDGHTARLNRETYRRGNAAAVLPVDPSRGTVLLVRQFRLPTLCNDRDGMMVEAIAGLLDGKDARATAIREAAEEAGVRLHDVRFLFDAFMSPGSFTEKLSFFLATYRKTDRLDVGGGLREEGEDIEVIEWTGKDAIAAIAAGDIVDAKTIMLLQHARIAGLI